MRDLLKHEGFLACFTFLGFCGMIFTGLTVSHLDENATIRAAIEAGADPIEAYCALGNSHDDICVIATLKDDSGK